MVREMGCCKIVHHSCPYFLVVLYRLTGKDPITGADIVTTKLIDYGCARKHSDGSTIAQDHDNVVKGEIPSSRS